MTGRAITVGYLYPEIMSGYGDRGNLAAITRRCGWRGIAADVRELRLGDPVDPGEVDLFVIGNGGEFHQRLIATDLADVKGPGICEAVDDGAALLAVGAGYELLGRFYQPARGVELPGARLFDTWTIQQGADLTSASCTLAEARAGRAIGDLLVQWDAELLVGFENHSARTYLGPTARPLGQVVAGQGNNGDGGEGVRLGNAIGTYLRGPCLPRNPVLTDFLIHAALQRRYGEAELAPLPDQLEHAARDAAVARHQGSRPGRSRSARVVHSARYAPAGAGR
jgi:lipid II isoglutaminyl synthase (glutamine-hydrolysing)